jgi:uncharacterized SAM-binding protein YcdF (DUF218 family)
MKTFVILAFTAALGVIGWGAVRVAWQASRDESRPADVILILGAAEYQGRPSPVLRARLDHALTLYQRGLAPKLLTTGGHGVGSKFTEAEAARDYLVEKGVPAENILLEMEGTSTLQSVTAASEVMRRFNLRTCVMVSDGYHLFRAKRMMESLGLECYGSPRQGEEAELPHLLRLYVKQSAGYWLWRLGLAR